MNMGSEVIGASPRELWNMSGTCQPTPGDSGTINGSLDELVTQNTMPHQSLFYQPRAVFSVHSLYVSSTRSIDYLTSVFTLLTYLSSAYSRVTHSSRDAYQNIP